MRRPRHVLFVLHRGGRAGTEYHVLWLASELRTRGWDADLVASQSGPILRDFADAGVGVHIVRRGGGTAHRYVGGLARLGRSLAPDILHAHSGRLAALAARLAQIPVIVETRHGLGLGPRLSTEARLCRLAHHTLTVCESDRVRLMAGGLPADRVTAVPNGIPAPRVGPHPIAPDRLRLGFLGRMTAQKNPLFLVDLAREVEARIPGAWSLAVAGDGPMRCELERRIAGDPRLASAVSFFGETEGPGLVLESSDMLCAPSSWEGQPLALLEAMAVGVVPIATPLPSLVELLGGTPPAGLLVEPDPTAWAEELITLHRSRRRMDALAEEGKRRSLLEHTVPAMVDRIEDLYRVLFASRQGDC